MLFLSLIVRTGGHFGKPPSPRPLLVDLTRRHEQKAHQMLSNTPCADCFGVCPIEPQQHTSRCTVFPGEESNAARMVLGFWINLVCDSGDPDLFPSFSLFHITVGGHVTHFLSSRTSYFWEDHPNFMAILVLPLDFNFFFQTWNVSIGPTKG